MIRGIWTIYRKELIDTLRDRRTLIFMLLLPVLALPAMMFGINKIVESAVRKQQSQVVKVAADQETQDAYLRLVHRWYLGTDIAHAAQNAQALGSAVDVVQSLMSAEKQESSAQVPNQGFPPEIFDPDKPEAFKAFVDQQAQLLREDIDLDKTREEFKQQKVEKALVREGLDFYRVALKGLGLVEFVDPATLPEPPDEFQPAKIPDDVQGMDAEQVRRIAYGIRNKTIAGYLKMPPVEALDADPKDNGQQVVVMVHDSTVDLSDEAFDRISRAIGEGGKTLGLERLDIRYLAPIKISEESDLATDSDLAMKIIGGILPYLVIAFAFLGGMYPAIDIAAGEKERNTLETLILAPVTRTEIATGKFLVIFTTSLTASLLGLASMAASFKYVASSTLLSNLEFQMSPVVATSVALLVIPPAAAFAGLFLAISIYARSFKEAQSYMAPLQFVLILPALAPALPGIEMSWGISFIPLVNVSMLAKDFLKGDIHWGYYAVTITTCLAAAAACVAFAIWQFRREEVLFRT